MRSLWGATALAAVASLGLVACGGGEAESTATRSQSIPTSMLSEGGTRVEPPAQEFTLDEIGFDFGSEDAPIKVVEFSDFGCGYCRKFHTETFPTLLSDFIEAGVVQWKYVTYVSGMFPNGLPAAYAAECVAEQVPFESIMQLLYERQGDWKGSSEPYPTLEALVEEVGADVGPFRDCVGQERPKPRIRSGILSGARLGVRGTPSFLVDGLPLVGAQPLQVWQDIIEAQLAAAER